MIPMECRLSRRSRAVGRPGFSLIELLMALVIFVIGAGTLFFGLSSGRQQFLKADVLLTGRLLARAVMARVQHLHRIRDPRFSQLGTPVGEVLTKALAGEWKDPFEALSHARAPFFGSSGPDDYLGGDEGPVLPTGPGADNEMKFWRRFSFEVRVSFDVQQDLATAAVPIDSNGDGRGETDLARVDVEIFYQPPEDHAVERAVCQLTTILASRDKTPGVGVLSVP